MIEAYIERYGARLYALCLRLCGNAPDAQDLYQDTWCKILRFLPKFDPSGSFPAWATRICVNTYRDMLRRRKLVSFAWRADQEGQQALLEAIPAPQRDADHRAVREAVDALPASLRLCVLLYYFHGQSVAEAAQALSLPEGTVKSRLSRARAILKKELTLYDG